MTASVATETVERMRIKRRKWARPLWDRSDAGSGVLDISIRPPPPSSGCQAIDSAFGHDEIDPAVGQRAGAFVRIVDDRLFMHVEAGVDQHRHAGQRLVGGEDVVIERILPALDDLGTRLAVNMHHRGNARLPAIAYPAGRGHESGGI